MLDRLLHHSAIFNIKKESYRLQKKRLQQEKQKEEAAPSGEFETGDFGEKPSTLTNLAKTQFDFAKTLGEEWVISLLCIIIFYLIGFSGEKFPRSSFPPREPF